MAEFWAALSHNIVLVAAFTAWAAAQVMKMIITYRKMGTVNIEILVASGGMPSSHTSLVVALATALAMEEGVGSPLFAIAVVFASVVMYDAAGVRRAAGKQASVLNKLIQELKAEHTINDARLKELLGHTPTEVWAGAALGMGVAYIIDMLYR